MRTDNWLGDFLLAVFCLDFAKLLWGAYFHLYGRLRAQHQGRQRGCQRDSQGGRVDGFSYCYVNKEIVKTMKKSTA